jgi:hypothetical protein
MRRVRTIIEFRFEKLFRVGRLHPAAHKTDMEHSPNVVYDPLAAAKSCIQPKGPEAGLGLDFADPANGLAVERALDAAKLDDKGADRGHDYAALTQVTSPSFLSSTDIVVLPLRSDDGVNFVKMNLPW